MIELHEYRTEYMEKKQWGITKLYNAFFNEPSTKLYQLHQQLDKLVMKAYNFDKKEDLLAQILSLNLAIYEAENNNDSEPPLTWDRTSVWTSLCLIPVRGKKKNKINNVHSMTRASVTSFSLAQLYYILMDYEYTETISSNNKFFTNVV